MRARIGMLIFLRSAWWPTASRSATDDDRTSALLILASSVDPNLATTRDRVVLSSNDPQPHDQTQRHSAGGQEAGGLVSSDAVGP
jgi:hypothetical protein